MEKKEEEGQKVKEEEKLIVTKPITINDRMKDMQEKMDLLFETKASKKLKKGFKLPSGVTRGWKVRLKKNYCVVQVIKSNGNVDFKMLPIVDDTVQIPVNDTYHLATPNYMMRYKQFPLLIIPEWNLIPFNPKEDLIKASERGSLSLPEKIIINKVKMAQAGMLKKKIPGKTILIIGVCGVAALYFISQIVGGGSLT